jgi:fibronectin-binding autotransporter adhesin
MRAFILGLLAVFWSGLAMGQTLYTFNGGGTTGDWNTASTWTTDPTGSTAINQRVPKAGDNVVVTNSYVVTLSSNIATSITGLNVTVQRGGQLDLKTFTLPALNSLSGQGVLRIATAYFPSVTTNNFDDPNTGTVEFYNWPAGASTLPRPASNFYNNLRLLNTTSAAYTVQLNNDLTLSGNLTLTRTVALTGTPQPSAVIFNLGSTTTATARTLNVQGDINIGAGTTLGIAAVNLPTAVPAGGGTAVQTFHALNAYGSLINNGIVNLHNGTTDDKQTALLTFMGATDAKFACNGPTALSALQLNKGLDSQVLLNVTATVASGGSSASNLTLNQIGDGRLLILINGVIKFGNNIYLPSIHNGTIANNGVAGSGYYELGSPSNSPTLWVDGATVINKALGTTIYGRLRVSNGTFESITPYATVLREDAQVLIEGTGTVNVQKFRPSAVTNGVSPRGSFVMTGGLLDCRGTNTASTIETGYSRFSMPYPTQSFRMTGGTIRVQNPDGTTDGAFHIGVDPNNAIVTGGTIEVLLPNTNTNAKVLSTAPLWNLTISKASATGTSKAIISALTAMTGANTAIQPLTVLNDFYLDGTNPTTFDANSQNVNIQGTLTINSGATYLPGANTTTFSGGQDQLLVNNGTIGTTSGRGTFNNWTINKSAGTLTLGGSVMNYYTPTSATLSLLSGVLNDGGKTIYVQGGLINSASHTSGGGQGSITLAGTSLQTVTGDGTGVFGNLNIANTTTANSTATPRPVAVQFTANMAVANYMSFLNDAIVNIGANRLALTNVDQDALTTTTTFSSKCMIQTSGNQSDLGLQKTFGGNSAPTFPVGVGTRYMPATIQLTSGVPLDKYGQVSVSPTNTRNPFTTNNNTLPYYWKVRSTGFSTLPTGGISLRFTMNNADASGAGTYTNYIPARYSPVAWTTSGSNSIQFGTGTTANSIIRFLSNSQFDGEFTAGESGAFGPITSFYSRTNGAWNANTTWNTSTDGGTTKTAAGTGIVPGAGNPVFIGAATSGVYHTVTVTAAGAKSGSLVIDRGSTLDVGTTSNTTTPHNFGALPDAKIGGSGRLRVSSSTATATFPGGDFGSFIQYGGGTVEYYTTGTSFTVPTSSGSLTLNQYRNLWLNAASGQTITLPNQDLRVYAQLKTGVANVSGTTTTTFPGTVVLSATTTAPAAGNLRVDSLLAVQAGVFRYANGVARAITVDTDVQVDAGATFDVANSTAVANTLTVGGSLVNNGTLDFRVGTGQVGLTFLGSKDAVLTSAGSLTDLYSLTMNKGLGRTALLNLDGAGEFRTPGSGWLTLTNGTLRYAKPANGAAANNLLTIHDATTSYLLTDNVGLTVDTNTGTVAIATNNSAGADLRLAGQLRIVQGTLRVGANTNTGGNDLEYASAGAPGITITGGNLYVNGQIRRTVSNLDGSLRFDQSGGTIDIDGQGATAAQNNERGLFEVQGPGSIFRMSAGSLNLHRSNQKSPILTADLYLAPDSTVVIGGTVNLGNTTSINSNVTISVSSTVPLYDMQVVTGNSGSTNTGLLTGVIPLTLKGSLTIGNDFSAFNANGIGLNIAQNLVNNNTSADPALNTGGFQPITTTQLTTFTGGIATQLLTGTAANLTTFGSLTLNTPQTNGTLQLGGNAQVAGTLTLAKGTLNDNDRTITALGDVLNSATHTSDGNGTGKLILAGTTNQNVGGNDKGRFGNVTLSNAAGATTTANQEITKVLTLSSGVLTIGSNLLWLSSPSTGAVTGYSAARFIRTNGIVADLGVRKNYPSGALDFTFPVGAADKYTPVVMNVKSNATAGTLTVQPIDLAHPSTTDPTAPATPNKITFYWKVSSTLSAPTVDQQFTYGDNDVLGNESLYKLGRFYNGAWTPVGGIAASTVDAASNTLSNLSYAPNTGTIDGDYTGGDATEFGVVPTFYSRNSTAGQPAGAVWTNASAWTNNSDGSDPAPTFNTYPTLANPVVISSGHLIKSTSAGLGAANLLLQGTLDLGTNGANNFNTVRGTGTVRIGSALFPAGNYAAFVAPNGGTVDYSGAVQLPARDTYNNLTFSGGNSKLLSNLDLTINGALSLASGTTVDNPTSQNITLTSATSGATLNGTFNLNDGNLTTGAFLTNGGTLKLGAGLTSIGTDLTNSGTLTNGTGDVTVGAAFSNSGTYSAKGGAGNLTVGTTFTNSNSYLAGLGKLTVNSDLNNATGGTFTAASGGVAVNGNFVNGGIYNAASNILRLAGNFTNTGTFRANASTTSLYGNFTNSGTFAMGTSLMQFITTDGNRLFSGNTTFYDVQKVGSATLAFNTNTVMTVSDMLTMREGLISTGVSSTLALTNVDTQPIVGASPTTYVAGRLAMTLPDAAASIRTFPVGLGGRYRPVTITPQAASTSPVVLVEIFNKAPTGPIDNALSNISANRYYRIQLQSGTISQPIVQLSFNTDVTDESITVPGNVRVAQSNGPNGTWFSTGGAGVFSPDYPRGYTISAASQTTIDANSFFAVASTNFQQNPLTGRAPLPVQLLSFTAARQGSAVRVAWATALEKNSAYFIVQRSADGHTFADVEKVAAQGNSFSRHDYASLDASPLAGLSYYRLRQVDVDGTSAYSPVVAVRFDGQVATAAPTLVAYPNPSTGQSFRLLTTNLAATGGTVQLFDNVGRLVLTNVATVGMTETIIAPAQPLASGIYIATWQTADGVKLTTKVVVN